jgi:hypothetical protein
MSAGSENSRIATPLSGPRSYSVEMDPDRTGQVLPLFPQVDETAGRQRVHPARRQEEPEPLWRELAGQVLRSERIEQGRTLQQISERAGVSPQYRSEVERGRKDASSEMLESICGALGLRLSDLLTASSRTLTATRIRLSAPQMRPSGVTSMAA